MTQRAHNPNGAVIWRGPSEIDGAEIVVIATGLKGSANRKTGNQVQVSILRADMLPTDALKGADSSICGDCQHRPAKVAERRAAGLPVSRCYINVGQWVQGVWRAFERGSYAEIPMGDIADLFSGRDVRLGAYGDPAAAPFGLWRLVTAKAASVTAYTHQWATCDQRLSRIAMASTDSLEEYGAARLKGWRSFRVGTPGDAPLSGLEVQCPASKEMGAKTTCQACKACGGTSAKARASILIWDHSASGAAAARRFQLTRNGAVAA